MRLIGNIIWFVFVGLISFVVWTVVGVLWCITIIGIPFGLQCFKIAFFVLWPMGTEVFTNFDKHPIANLLWIIIFGWEITLFYLFAGLLFTITIIGIPFGQQCFKLVRLSLLPFGAVMR